MRALVVYESMYGNTHTVAEAIGQGLRAAPAVEDVVVCPVGEADQAMVDGAALVVVGGPTHAHSMSRESTREQAVRDAAKPGTDLQVEPGAEGVGVREWLETLKANGTAAVAFDTRVDIPTPLSGRASKAIGRALRHHGFAEVARPESFLVTRDNHLEPGEDERARAWGEALALRVAVTSTT